MRSILFATTARFVAPILFLFALFLLWRGHNDPGGGFIGGLVVASALALYAIAFGTDTVRSVLRVDPRLLLGLGLMVSLASGLIGMASGRSFLSGVWVELGGTKLGTPLLFDLGVMLVVVGAASALLTELGEEERTP